MPSVGLKPAGRHGDDANQLLLLRLHPSCVATAYSAIAAAFDTFKLSIRSEIGSLARMSQCAAVFCRMPSPSAPTTKATRFGPSACASVVSVWPVSPTRQYPASPSSTSARDRFTTLTHGTLSSAPDADRATYVKGMFGDIAARYDLMNTLMTGGQHHLWRSLAARALEPNVFYEPAFALAAGAVLSGIPDQGAHALAFGALMLAAMLRKGIFPVHSWVPNGLDQSPPALLLLVPVGAFLAWKRGDMGLAMRRLAWALVLALIGTKIKDEKNPFEIVRIIRSMDPCLACAIHVITPKGREIGRFKVC